jgi:outer membrane immunogenic protein
MIGYSKRASIVAVAAVATFAGLAVEAHAADLGSPRGRPSRDAGLPQPLQIERWTGFYFGAGIGYSFGDTALTGPSGAFDIDNSGALGTAFFGYNWQVGRAVLGIEADIGTGNVGGSAQGANGLVNHEINALGSLRARAGLLMSPALLVYGTAGFAWADYDFRLASNAVTSETLTGYQLGFGAEHMIAPNWTLRLEYLYTDLDPVSATSGGITNRFDPDTHTVRAGVAFKF